MSEGQAIEAHTESSPNAPNIGQVVAIQRPDWVAEKFYDSKSGVINFEAMAKSYSELERSKSAPKPDETPEPEAGETKPTTEKVVTPIEVPTIPGVDQTARKAYTEELTKDGKLSDTSYTALAKAGYDKATVDAYIKGLQSDSRVTESVSAARVADEQINEIIGSIGGKQVLSEMQAWAKASMSDADLKTYNESVSSGDVSKVRLAVAGLHHTYTKANGTGENLLSGSNNVNDAADVFHSRAEQNEAINDPKYAKDPAYRARVSAKIGRSNF
jgi:hypothetical protein